MKRFFVLSILIHFIFSLPWLCRFLDFENSKAKNSFTPKPTFLSFDLIPTELNTKKAKQERFRTSKYSGSTKIKNKKRPNLASLFQLSPGTPSSSTLGFKDKSMNPTESENTSSITSGDHRNGASVFGPLDYGEGQSLQGVLIRGKPLEQLANKILNEMIYHQSLIDQNIEGDVKLKLALTPQLQLMQWDRPTGTNDTLTAFAFVSLLKILKTETAAASPSKLNPKNTLKVELNFHFKTQFSQPGVSQKYADIVDPLIHLHFVSFREPDTLRWMNEHIPAIVLPLPGGGLFLVNVMAVKKMIEDWDKVSPDQRRKQMFRELSETWKHNADEFKIEPET